MESFLEILSPENSLNETTESKKEPFMNRITIAFLLAFGLSSFVLADEKHPKDPCPKGSYEVTITETTTNGGSISSEFGVDHIMTSKLGSEGKIERSRTETYKVCREKAEKAEKRTGRGASGTW